MAAGMKRRRLGHRGLPPRLLPPPTCLHLQHDLRTKEHHKVHRRRQDQQLLDRFARHQVDAVDQPCDPGQVLDRDRQHEHQVQLEIGKQPGKCQEHTAAQIAHAGRLVRSNKRRGDRGDPAQQQVDVEPKRPPLTLQRTAHDQEQVQRKKDQDARARRDTHERHQPPPLSGQYPAALKLPLRHQSVATVRCRVHPTQQQHHPLPHHDQQRDVGDRKATETSFQSIQ